MKPYIHLWESRARSFSRLLLPLAVAVTSVAFQALGQNVLTGNYDNQRTNANLSETKLNPSTVAPGQFGHIRDLPVEGQVYAQPLYVSAVEIPNKGIYDLVIVATMNNMVYAFDANPRAKDPLLWKVNLGRPVPTANYSVGAYYDDVLPENGILSTPVIDAATQRLFIVAATFADDKYAYTLHALDIRTGSHVENGKVEINAEVEGTGAGDDTRVVKLDPFWQMQRPGLLLSQGKIYIAFGSHGGAGPYYGWIVAYDATDIRQQVGVFNTAPDTQGSSVWMSGRGPAADTEGSVYVVTGNGPFDGTRSFGESVLKFDPHLELQSWFTPDNYLALTEADNDFGASGAAIIPSAGLVTAGGKIGLLHVLREKELGGLSRHNAGAVQVFQSVESGVYTMAIWDREDGPRIYVHGAWEPARAYQLKDGSFDTTPISKATEGGGIPYYGMVLSANGGDANSGILWVTSTGSGYTGRAWPGILRAFDANDLSHELWNSEMEARDSLPSFAKFATPTVANGLVFVPTFSNKVAVYGLKSMEDGQEKTITVLNAFSLAGAAVSPGELVEVRGHGIGPDEPIRFGESDPLSLPDILGGVRVLFDGQPAPLVEVSADRLVAVVPYSVQGAGLVAVEATRDGVPATPLFSPVDEAHPGLKTADGTGMGPGAFINEDGSRNALNNAATFNSIVSIQITGVGVTTPANQGVNDVANPGGLAVPTLAVTATIGGINAEVVRCEGLPGAPGAILNLQLRVPESSPTGVRIPVIVRVGKFTAPAVTLNVQ